MKDGKDSPKTYVLEIIPIAKGGGRNTLSYFSTHKPKVGTIIKTKVRNREIKGIVRMVRSVRDIKTEVRRSPYALKKISKRDILDVQISPELISAVEKTAEYYTSTLGEILVNVLPKFVLDNPQLLKMAGRKKVKKTSIKQEPLAIQMEYEERFGHYRSVIRQSFAKKHSILFITPSTEEAERAHTSLSKGIENYAFLVSSKMKDKDRVKVWTEAMNTSHPVLMVTTSSGAVFDRPDLKTVIVERESSRAYRSLTKPYVDARRFIKHLTELTGKDLVFGDLVLSIEALQKIKEGQYGELSPIKWRLSPATGGLKTSIVDMRREARGSNIFEIFSPEVKELLTDAEKEQTGVFLFGARKGLAPSTVCGDCGSLLACKNCGAPVVLHRVSEGKNIYVCHVCRAKRASETTCDSCHGWKLIPLGIGTDTIANEVTKLFPHANVRLVDKDHVSSANQAQRVVKGFEKDGGILVGTELALYYLERVPRIAIVSIDSLFAIPDFGAEEKIFRLISQLREISEKEIIIQTRKPEKEVLQWASQGNIADFYKREIEERRELFYPPFSIFIKIDGEEIASVKHLFDKWRPVQMRNSLVIRMRREEWPEPELAHNLSLLGPQFSIKVDPESII